MVFKDNCVLVQWTKVVSALEGLKCEGVDIDQPNIVNNASMFWISQLNIECLFHCLIH